MTERELATLEVLSQGGHLVDDFDSDQWFLYPVGEESRLIGAADKPPGFALQLDSERSTGRTNAYRISDAGRAAIESQS